MSVIEKIMCGKAFPAAGLTGRPVAEPAVERTIETLQRYHRLGVLCLAAGILWLILAIFLYMYFRMGRVIGSLTGYRERKAIRKWEETELLRIECKKDEKPGKRSRGRRLLWTLVLAGSMLGAAEVSAEEAGEEPRVEIHCGEPGRVLGETQYYREDVELQILVLRKGEESPEEPERELKVYCTERYTGERQELTGAVSWRDTEEGREGSWRLTREGTFRLTVEMEQGETDVQVWSSPWLVLDKTPPRLWAELSEEPEKVLDGKSCFRTATVLRIQVEDAHWRVQELKEELEGLRVTGERGADVTEESKCRKRIRELDGGEQPEGLWQWELPIREDGCFDIPVGLTDLAGNPAVWAEPDSRPEEERFQIMLDQEGPKLELTGLSGETGTAGFGSYAPDGVWFSDGKLLLRCRALDEVSGLTELRVRVTGENGEERILEPNEEADETDEHKDEEQIWERELFLELPWPEGPGRGSVMLEAEDRLGNRTWLQRGFTAESAERHREAGSIRILTETRPSRVVDGTAWYNQDVRLCLEIRDLYSGIRSWNWQAGELERSRDYLLEAEQAAEGELKEITWEYTGELVLDAEEYDGQTVKAGAVYEDNAGHGGSAEAAYHVDATKPVITVEYEGPEPEPGEYYRESRTAVVNIREQNLDPGDVELRTELERTEGEEPEISGWSVRGEGKNREYSCRVTFSADGEYAFTVACQDLAGNRADYDRVDRFTIDRTAPAAGILWSGAEAGNDFYYPGERIAQIRIRERNFAEEAMEIRVEEQSGEEKEDGTGHFELSGWENSGDLHTVTVRFPADGSYTLSVSGKDLAGNEMDAYESAPFVIDQTPPELQITGVEDGTANQGEVRPVILCEDSNYDPEGTQVFLTGYERGSVEPDGERQEGAYGFRLELSDFPYIKEADDLYSLRVTVRDLAGNTSESSLRFSVNRFGSVYVLEKETEELAGKGGSFYTNQEPELVIREINVDYLDFRKVVCSRNGHPSLLEEGRDYEVEESGGEKSWKEYRYRIWKENFTEEGIYAVTLCSGDRAGNLSDNPGREKQIEFAVDRTGPEILLSGVEDGGTYRTVAHDIRLEIRDNLKVREAWILWNGEKRKLTSEELNRSGGRTTFRAESRNHWQELRVEAVDGAGNRTVSEKVRFLVTPSLLVQLAMNQKIRAGCMVAVLAAVAGTVVFYRRKRK